MPWWGNNTLRMVQFNLQQEDAAVDVERVVSQLKEFHANAVMTGAGGITAYYPTALPWHYRSPSLGDGDMLGEMVRLCHSNGIRVIARFDFSKIHESVAMAHPDWLYRDAEGNIVNYHGMVHTCLSGEYQQVHSLEILKECLTQYPVDGIYINMFGYKTYDYDGVNHGICHCENCVRRTFSKEGYIHSGSGRRSAVLDSVWVMSTIGSEAWVHTEISGLMLFTTWITRRVISWLRFCCHENRSFSASVVGSSISPPRSRSVFSIGYSFPVSCSYCLTQFSQWQIP